MILHLITDRRRLAGRDARWPDERRCVLAQARCAVEAGVAVVQLREPDLDARSLYEVTCELVSLAAGTQTRIVVNDRTDIALAAHAHGVHLRGDSMPPAIVRRLAPVGFLIGRSVHAVDEAVRFAADVDYLIAGTVWATPSKPTSHALLGPEGIARLVSAVRVPVLAIGGVRADRLAELARAGAAGAAAIGMFIADRTGADTAGDCGAIALHDLTRRASAHDTVAQRRRE